MNSLFIVVSIFTAILTVVFAVRTYYSVIDLINYFKYRDTTPSLEKYEGTECIRHNWDSVTLAMRPLPTQEHKVCKSCGRVSGTIYRLNGPAKEVYLNILNRRAEQKIF